MKESVLMSCSAEIYKIAEIKCRNLRYPLTKRTIKLQRLRYTVRRSPLLRDQNKLPLENIHVTIIRLRYHFAEPLTASLQEYPLNQ